MARAKNCACASRCKRIELNTTNQNSSRSIGHESISMQDTYACTLGAAAALLVVLLFLAEAEAEGASLQPNERSRSPHARSVKACSSLVVVVRPSLGAGGSSVSTPQKEVEVVGAGACNEDWRRKNGILCESGSAAASVGSGRKPARKQDIKASEAGGGLARVFAYRSQTSSD